MSAVTACPLCAGGALWPFLLLERVPTQDGILWASPEAARDAPRGDIELVVCRDCGYVWNRRYDPALVRFEGYDVALDDSPMFAAFVDTLASRLVREHDLTGGHVLDVGCGRGRFLAALVAAGAGRGTGIDPSGQGADEPAAQVRIVRGLLDGSPLPGPFDLVACRHVLDIVDDPVRFAALLAKAARPSASLYVEVPDARHTFGALVPWNVVYEHRAWFVPCSLARLFASHGLEVVAVEPCWNDEYLALEARPGPGRVPAGSSAGAGTSELLPMLERFADEIGRIRQAWAVRARELAAAGRRVAIWGAGARAIGLLTLVPELEGAVTALVDVNPRRQGLYAPPFGLHVQPPATLLESRPDIVVISNPTYGAEIRRQAAELGLETEFLSA